MGRECRLCQRLAPPKTTPGWALPLMHGLGKSKLTNICLLQLFFRFCVCFEFLWDFEILHCRYVLECRFCGVIYRSRQYWYGNEDPDRSCIQTEICHVWPGVCGLCFLVITTH